MTGISGSQIEVRGRGGGSGEEEGKMAPHPTSERETVGVGAPEIMLREVRGESGEGEEREDGEIEGRGEDEMTGGAPAMRTG